MKRYLILTLLFCCTNLYSQKKPIDTVYYDNGSIKRISFEQNKYLSYPVDVYYRKTDNETIGFKYLDTMYYNIQLNRKNKRSLEITQWVDNQNKNAIGFVDNKYKWLNIDINSYKYQRRFYHNIQYFEDNTIRDYRIGIYDNKKENFGLKNYMFIKNNEKGSNISQVKTVTLDSFGSLEIKMDIFNKVKKILYIYPKNNEMIYGEEYHFDTTTGFLKEYGFFDYYGNKIGLWQEYYKNGNICSQGNYIIDSVIDRTANIFNISEAERKKQKEKLLKIITNPKERENIEEMFSKPQPINYIFESKKNGKWIFFNEEGYQIKIEEWKIGVLIDDRKDKYKRKK